MILSCAAKLFAKSNLINFIPPTTRYIIFIQKNGTPEITYYI